MSALEKYIRRLQDPAPEFRDPENIEDETAAQLAPRAADGSDNIVPSFQPSALRRRATASLWHEEGGRKTSRKELYRDDEESVSSEEGHIEMEEEEVEGDESEEEEKDGEMFEEEKEDEEEEEEEESDVEESDVEESDVESDELGEEDQDEMQEDAASDEEITSDESEEENVIKPDADVDEKEKASAVVQQLDLWDRLMEARIQLQKVLSLANRLPSTASVDPQSEHLAKARDALVEMEVKLYNISTAPSSPMERKADTDVVELARQSHESLSVDRNRVLTFWTEKTQLASKSFKKFKSYQTPVVKQLEQILSDRDRLIRRTQVIRDDTADLCEKPEEVFDDCDFYQRLLKNLIESKTTDVSKMSTSASQWLEVQRLRGKKKKKDVDTRASKGRKLRYNVHTKLVNFMFPRDDSTWSEDAKNELFKNLFKMPTHAEL